MLAEREMESPNKISGKFRRSHQKFQKTEKTKITDALLSGTWTLSTPTKSPINLSYNDSMSKRSHQRRADYDDEYVERRSFRRSTNDSVEECSFEFIRRRRDPRQQPKNRRNTDHASTSRGYRPRSISSSRSPPRRSTSSRHSRRDRSRSRSRRISSRGPREPSVSAMHKHRNHTIGQKAGPANFFLKKFDHNERPKPSNKTGPLEQARTQKPQLGNKDARHILDGSQPKPTQPKKQRPKDNAKGVINAIKRSAFETIDSYIEQMKPANFANTVTCLENARQFLAEHFGKADSPDMLINRADAAESRYNELFRVALIYKQIIDNIMDNNQVATAVIGLKGGPPVSPKLEDLLRETDVVYTTMAGKSAADNAELLMQLPSGRDFELLDPSKNSFRSFCKKFCEKKNK